MAGGRGDGPELFGRRRAPAPPPARGHAARLYWLAMRPVTLTFVLALAGAPLLAQEASPYLPISHWSTPFIEHLIAAGRMADPSPLSRPFKVEQVVRALAAVDSTVVTGAEWAVVKQIRGDLT